MKAVCVRPDRNLEVRDLAMPTNPAPAHLLVDIDAAAINHGDKMFLKLPPLALGPRTNDVWGASGAGRVIAVGEGVPEGYVGRSVAVYRSLRPTAETMGLWCDHAQVHHQCCLVLPDHVRPRDYCGSLVNIITAYAFLQQAADDGHCGIVATAGASATGRALAALARRRGVPVIPLVRSGVAREELQGSGVDHVLDTSARDFEQTFETRARDLKVTAIFDGLGGEIVGRIAPRLPENGTFYFYGFLAGAAPVSFETSLFMTKNLLMRRFSNFASSTVTDRDVLGAALADLRDNFDPEFFRTNIGKEFGFDDIDAAMSFETAPGSKAVLVA